MSFITRCLFVLFLGWLPPAFAIAQDGRHTAIAAESNDSIEGNDRMARAVASCQGNRQCEEAVRRRESAAAEKRRQREAADKALRDADPSGYYLAMTGRYLAAAAFIAAAAGLYVLVMHRLFGKRRRRRESDTGS